MNTAPLLIDFFINKNVVGDRISVEAKREIK
jgi:hypothetical protein